MTQRTKAALILPAWVAVMAFVAVNLIGNNPHTRARQYYQEFCKTEPGDVLYAIIAEYTNDGRFFIKITNRNDIGSLVQNVKSLKENNPGHSAVSDDFALFFFMADSKKYIFHLKTFSSHQKELFLEYQKADYSSKEFYQFCKKQLRMGI